MCNTRYEHEYDRKNNVLYGLEIKSNFNRNKKTECIYSQDTWIFKMEKINVNDTDIMLGIPGCDNMLIKKFIDSGYNVINSSRYICCNHFDHSSKNSDKSKGKNSNYYDRVGSKEEYYFLQNGIHMIDRYCSNIKNDIKNNIVNIKYDISTIPLINILDNNSQLSASSYIIKPYICKESNCIIWEPIGDDPEKTLIIRFGTCVNVEYMDVMTKSYDDDNIEPCSYVKTIKISFSINGKHWIKLNHTFNCINTGNYDYIKRLYMPFQLYCCGLKIEIFDYNIKPYLKCNICVKSSKGRIRVPRRGTNE